MPHSQSVKLNTPIPSISDYGKRLGLSKARQRDLIRLVNPDLASEVQITGNKVALKSKSAETVVGKVVAKDLKNIVVQVLRPNFRTTSRQTRFLKVTASDRFELAGVGDRVRIVKTIANAQSKPMKITAGSVEQTGWALDEVVSRSNVRVKQSKTAAR